MRRFIPALTLLLAGCATSPDTGSTGMETPIDSPEVFSIGDRMGEGMVSNVQPGVDRISVGISASPDAVWDALVQVYADVGIEIAGADPGTRSLNNPNFVLSRRLGGQRLSRYLECGSGSIGGFADHFRIQMSILSQVEAKPDGLSTLHTTIQAIGDNPEGTSNTRVPCSSTHQLERRIAAEVGELVGG
jgi:hypothetical protein